MNKKGGIEALGAILLISGVLLLLIFVIIPKLTDSDNIFYKILRINKEGFTVEFPATFDPVVQTDGNVYYIPRDEFIKLKGKKIEGVELTDNEGKLEELGVAYQSHKFDPDSESIIINYSPGTMNEPVEGKIIITYS
jgi:hypothetical protein